MIQRSEAEHPDAPTGLVIIAAADDGRSYVRHPLDSRGSTWEQDFAMDYVRVS